jgi:hypothetical protein
VEISEGGKIWSALPRLDREKSSVLRFNDHPADSAID